ncbi:hypothetical protein PMAYCL1PPCAC_13123, partial [Pristionchus mayeri]
SVLTMRRRKLSETEDPPETLGDLVKRSRRRHVSNMGDSVQYSTSTREPIGLPSISTFTPMLSNNNGVRDQHSPRFAPSHTTHSTSTSSSATSSSADSKPFSASISFAPLGSKQQPPTQKRDAPPHPSGPPAAIFHSEPMTLVKKKSPMKKHSPPPKNGPPPAKKLALTPLSPPKNGSNGGPPSGMPALEAALRSPVDSDSRRLPPPQGAGPGPGPGSMMPPGTPGTSMGQQGRSMHHAVVTSGSRNMEFSLEGLSPFNPNEECGLMQGPPTSNGNNGYGYTPSPSNGHRGYFGETPRDSPMTLAPLEPLTTTFSTHSPAPHNGGNPYYQSDWANPSLASPMTLPPLNTIFSGHSSMDQSHSSTQFSSSPISAYSDPSPSASLLSISLPHGQQQSVAHAAPAARPQSRPAADYGQQQQQQQHYSGPLSHQSSSSIVWEEPPPPPTPTIAPGGHPKTAWVGNAMQQQPPGMPRRPSVRVTPHKMPGGKSPRPQDPAFEKVQQILLQSKAAESAAAAQKAAQQRGMQVAQARAGGVKENEKTAMEDPTEAERREKKRLAQNEQRRKKRAEKVEQDRIKAESGQGQLLLPVRQMSMQQHQQMVGRPMQQMQHPMQPPMRKMSDSEATCSITASINAVVHLDSSLHLPERQQRAPPGNRAATAAGVGEAAFSELKAAMLAEEMPLIVSRKESTSHGPVNPAANPTIVRQLQQPPVRPAHYMHPLHQQHHPMMPRPIVRKLASGVRKARETLMREYQSTLGPRTSPASSSRFQEVLMATRSVEDAQQKAEEALARQQLVCASLAEQTKLQHATLQMHLRKITNGEDTSGLPTTSRAAQQLQPSMVMREGATLRTLSLLDQEIQCRRDGRDPSDSRRRVSIAAILVPPTAPAAALQLAPPPQAPPTSQHGPSHSQQVKTEIKVETSSASTMTDRDEKEGSVGPPPSRRLLNDQSTRPLERVYLAGVKELFSEGYAVREGGIMARPRETRGVAAPVHLVDTEGRVWSEALGHSQRLQNGVQRREEGETMDERSSGRVLRSAHRHTSGYN